MGSFVDVRRFGGHHGEPMTTGIHFNQWTLGTAIASPSLATTSWNRPFAITA
jgi:hypothetical protein